MKNCLIKPQNILFLTISLAFNFLLLPLHSQAQPPKEDTQLWTETWISFPQLDPKFSYGYLNTSRFGREIGTLTDERHAAFFGYQFIKEFGISMQYVHVEQDPVKETHRIQHRALLDFQGSFSLPGFTIPYRLRSERQFRESLDDKWNFRPRIGVELPLQICDLDVRPFMNAETFYDSAPREWYRLRTLAGLSFRFRPDLSLDVYGGRQLERNTSATDLALGGITLRLHLPNI